MVTGGFTGAVLTDRVELLTFDAVNNPLPSCITMAKLPIILFAHVMSALPPSELFKYFLRDI
jgi:hypothetical protein